MLVGIDVAKAGLAAASLPIVVVNPRQARAFADALLARRRQLLEMLQAERNRLGQVFGRGKTPVRKSLTAHIAYLERDLRMTDSDLGDVVRRSPAWRERDARLQSVPGESASSCRSRSLPMSPSLGANRVARS